MSQLPTIHENWPLAPYTTLHVGGPARFFAEVSDFSELCALLALAAAERLPLVVLGGGSNVLIADVGLNAVVARPAVRELAWTDLGGDVEVRAGCGVVWDALVQESVARGLAGIECLSGIPGCVGGAPVQNIGAYGQEVGEVIRRVEAVDLSTGGVRRFTAEECAFSYRSTLFNTGAPGRYCITSVTLVLKPGGAPRLAYAELQRLFDAGRQPSLQQVREEVLRLRASKGTLLRPGDPDSRSAGSFFKNPVLPVAGVQSVLASARRRGAIPDEREAPVFPGPPGFAKLSAAWMIEMSGFRRGFQHGGAALSSKHALAIVNRQAASAADILSLARVVRDGVLETFGVRLMPEPVLLGFDGAL